MKRSRFKKINAAKKLEMIKYNKFSISRHRSKIIFALLILLTVCLIVFSLVKNYVFESSIARYKLVKPAKHQLDNKKVILFWTKFFEYDYYGMPNETNGEEFLTSLNCPVTNCILTHNKKYLSSPHEYDALVFHGASTWVKIDLPQTRSPHQLYVLATLE